MLYIVLYYAIINAYEHHKLENFTSLMFRVYS